MIVGCPTTNKTPPILYLNVILTRIKPRNPQRYIWMDMGGELARSHALQKLIQKHGYLIEPTGSDSSHQNGRVERPHQDIGKGIRALLYGASMPYNMWEHAFLYLIHVLNVTPHGTNAVTPYQKVTNRVPDLSHLRSFGCKMFALDSKKRDGKQSIENSIPGRFLCYGGSMKIFWYKRDQTGEICRAQYARFDEANRDAPPDSLTPNERALWNALDRSTGDKPDTDEVLTPPTDFCVFCEHIPFIDTR